MDTFKKGQFPLRSSNRSTMIQTQHGLMRFQVLLVLFCFLGETHCRHVDYELPPYKMNWTSAAKEYVSPYESPLAEVSSIEHLCEAQAVIISNADSDSDHWTALKLNNNGLYQWGLLANNTANIPADLLDRTEPVDRCYAISKSAITLQSRDCHDQLPVLTIIPVDERGQSLVGSYSDQCIIYLLSNCSRQIGNRSEWQALPYSSACQKINGKIVGSCQVENTLLTCCQTYCHSGNKTYSLDTGSGLDAKVRKVPRGVSSDVEISFTTSNNDEEDELVRVIISRKVFNDAERVVVATLHRMVGGQTSQWTFNNTDHGSHVLNSDVVGVVLSPPQNETFRNKIIIHFSHTMPVMHQGVVERKCVFWKQNLDSWSSDGCIVLNGSSNLTTVCSCNHLTNFAVLLQYKDIEIPPEHRRALLIITYIGCALSLVGEVLVVFVYVTFMKIKAEGIQVRLNLSTALFLAQVVFLSGIDATSNKSVCVSVAVLLHYLYLASFGWMMLEGVFLYIMIVEVFNTVNMRYLYLFGWGFPFIPVAISLIIGSRGEQGLQNYTNDDFCWLSFQKHLSWAFIVPVLLVSVINFGILMAVLREIRNLHDPNPAKLKTFRKTLKSFVILSPLLGLTWIFGLLTVADARLVFQYIFTILNSAQGMLIFLLHVLRNSEVRAAFHHKMLKWRFNIFYSSSSGRAHADVSQAAGKRKRQIDPKESKKEINHNTKSGQEMAFIVRLPTPSVH